jgi:hypothetical protein
LTNPILFAPIAVVKTILLATSLALGVAFLSGCEQKDAKSPYEVSIDQQSSAENYPAMLADASKRVRDRESSGKEEIGKIPTSADKISDDSDWPTVGKIVDASDAAGKDGGYAAERKKLEAARKFIDEEKDEIVKKIGGAVQYQAKQKGCDVDAWGAVGGAFKDAVDDRMKERLRANNDAFILIDRHEDSLGKKNRPALEEMADRVAEMSFLVHVEMPEAKAKLEAISKSAADAKSSIEKFIEEEKAFGAERSQKPDIAKASADRVKKAEDKLKELEAAQQDAQQNVQDLEQRAKDLEKSYDEALSQLKTTVDGKKKK